MSEWKMVPTKSTEEMNVAGCMAMRGNWGASDVYDAMLSAAPQPTEQEKLSDDQLIDEYCKTPGLRHHVQAFIAGARYAESIIGTAKPTDSGREG